MSRIYVNLSTMQDIKVICSASSNEIYNSKEQFRTAISNLDWNVKCEKDISVRAVRITYKLRSLNEALTRYSNFVDKAYFKYVALENYESDLSNVGDVSVFTEDDIFNTTAGPAGAKTSDSTNIDKPQTQTGVMGFINTFCDGFIRHSGGFFDFMYDLVKKKAEEALSFLTIYADIAGLTGAIYETVKEAIDEKLGIIEILGKIGDNIYEFLLDFLSDFIDSEDDPYDEKIGTLGDLSSLLKEMSISFNTMKEKGPAQALVEIDEAIEACGKLLSDMFFPAAQVPIAILSGVGSLITRLIGEVCKASEDGELTFKEILGAVGSGITSGTGTVASLLTKGFIDIDIEDGKLVWE